MLKIKRTIAANQQKPDLKHPCFRSPNYLQPKVTVHPQLEGNLLYLSLITVSVDALMVFPSRFLAGVPSRERIPPSNNTELSSPI